MIKAKALVKCMQMCSRKEYSVWDIEQKLSNWQVAEHDVTNIIDQLIAEKFLDEERFVKAYVNDKFKFNKWGKKKIAYALSQKAIPKNLIKQGLDSIAHEEYNDLIRDLIKEKQKKVKAESDFERNGKVANYMASRGFESNLIFKYLNSDEY